MPDSLSRTWALLIAAAILYVPANLLPVMQTSSMLGSSRDTIISGVVYFWTSGSPGLALLIFSVSILVPLIKLGALAYLAFSVRRPGATGPHGLGRLYRVVELAGYVKAGQWKGSIGEAQFGVNVHGKTLGLIGMGRIGSAVARRAHHGFDMPILYHNTRPNPEAERELDARYVSKEELLGAIRQHVHVKA